MKTSKIVGILGIALLSTAWLNTFLLATKVSATLSLEGGAEAAKGTDQPSTLFGDAGVFTQITNVMLFIVGAIAVIMIVIGGLRYVISGGDQAQITSAKNTILYAIVGIIVAMLGYAAVNFVLTTLIDGTSTGGTDV